MERINTLGIRPGFYPVLHVEHFPQGLSAPQGPKLSCGSFTMFRSTNSFSMDAFNFGQDRINYDWQMVSFEDGELTLERGEGRLVCKIEWRNEPAF